MTTEHDLSGTPGYISPEQLKGGPPSVQGDIYAFGVTMLELMPKNAPKSLRAIALKAASQDASQRYKTAGEVAKALERYIGARNRARRVALGVVATVVVAVAVGVVFEVRAQRTEVAALHRSEGEVRLANGDDLGAIEAFTRSLAVKADVLTLLDRGFCYYRMGEYAKAVADCEAALKMEPTNQAAKKNMEQARRYLK